MQRRSISDMPRLHVLVVGLMMFAACTVWAVEVEEVQELSETAHAGKGASPAELEDSAANFLKSERVGGGVYPQFPGPRYGLPGYKESHNWEGGADVDYMSPLIFDWQAYKDTYKMGHSTTEAAAKADWLDKLNKLSYPNCPTGREHDRPPDGFSLKQYYDGNESLLKAKLGETPKCVEIAKQFLSSGLYEGLPLAPALPCKTCPNADGTPPPSSWLLCKWRSWRRMPGYRRRYRMKTYSREIHEWDRMRSSDSSAMNGFQQTGSYTVTFWYRPQRDFVGEIFNFGEANRWYSRYYKSKMGNTAFFTPGVEQVGLNGGVRLSFQVSMSSNYYFKCTSKSNVTSTDATPGGVLPFNKWTYVALTVLTKGNTAMVRAYHDNQKSQVAQNNGGKSTGHVAQVAECEVQSTAVIPGGMRKYGYRVWSYYPGRRRRRRQHNNGGSVAGLTYWDQAMSEARVTSMYKYEENGVDAWSVADAESKNNGAC